MKFFHRIAGAKFIMPDGRELSFVGGKIDTDQIEDQELRTAVESELKKVANNPTSQVYTVEKPPVGQEEIETRKDLLHSAEGAFDQVNKITGTAQTVPVAVAGQQDKPVIPGSGVDAKPASKGSIEAAKKALEEAKAKTVAGSPQPAK